MNESVKKIIMLAIVVIAIVFLIVWVPRATKDERIDPDQYRGETVNIQCKSCEAIYQMDKAEYLKWQLENYTETGTPPMECEKCGEVNAFRTKDRLE